MTDAPAPGPGGPPGASAAGRAGLGIDSAVAILLVGVLVEGLAASAVAGADHRHDFAAVLVGFGGLWAGLVVAYMLVVRANPALASVDRSACRFRPTDPVFALAGVVLQFAVTVPYRWLPIDTERIERPAKELVQRAGSIGPGFAALCAATVIGAPLVEEWYFRWVLHGAFRRRFRVPVAVLASSGIFAAIHLQPLLIPALFAFGLACAVVRERTCRFWPSAAMHAGFNLVTMITLGVDLARQH